ncbi:hypothetical protein [Streptosporangium sp. NPDC049376]|uniref:hypothetical protein n=1 Tax=Streptosporangium sp. NPDC049376 TaxID=3366192 RepID=UPI003795D6EE
MPDNGTERRPDPRVAFAGETGSRVGETDACPGAAEGVTATTGAGGHLPPLAEERPDGRPLTQRFAEPEG